MTILILFVIAAAFFLLQKTLYRRYWSRGLSGTLQFRDSFVYEGDVSSLTEVVTNRNWLPLPALQVSFRVSRNLVFDNIENTSVSDYCYKRDVFTALFYQKIKRELPFRCLARGYYPVGSLNLVAHDLLMTTQFAINIDQNASLYVYPKPLWDDRLEVPFQKIMGTVRMRRLIHEDPYEFRGIREYQPTDPMRAVNWKASARAGELMVDVFHSTSSQEVLVLLDVEDSGVWKHHVLIETAIRLASSLVGRLASQGVPVRLACNGLDQISKNEIAVPAGAGQGQLHAVNRALARIDLTQPAASMEGLLTQTGWGDALAILISLNQTAGDAFSRLTEERGTGIWFVPMEAAAPFAPQAGRSVTVVPWEVEL